MARQKGTPKTGGRQKGTPNKTTAAVKGYILEVVGDYMQPAGDGKHPTLQADLLAMLPEDRVKAVTALAGYIIPKQQALSIDEQAQMETEALTQWLEEAPADAINAIAAKVLELQERNAGSRAS